MPAMIAARRDRAGRRKAFPCEPHGCGASRDGWGWAKRVDDIIVAVSGVPLEAPQERQTRVVHREAVGPSDELDRRALRSHAAGRRGETVAAVHHSELHVSVVAWARR